MKGVAVVWIYILISLFVIAFVYIIFSVILYSDTYGVATLVNVSTVNNTQAQSTISTINTVWRWWPLPLMVGLILWGIVSSQKREPDSVWYG